MVAIEQIDNNNDNGRLYACNLSAKTWNMPELHAAQPLDYLSQYP